MQAAFRSLNLPASYAESVFYKIDKNRTGSISREEVKVHVSGKMDRLRKAFNVVDKNGDGYISGVNLLGVCVCVCIRGGEREVERGTEGGGAKAFRAFLSLT